MCRSLTVVAALSLLLAVAAAGLGVRSYWTTHDWFLIYRAGGSEHLRAWRGYFVLAHAAPDGEAPRGGVERWSHHAVRTNSLPPDVRLSPADDGSLDARRWRRRKWGPVRWDELPGQPVGVRRAWFVASVKQEEARLAQPRQDLQQLQASASAAPPPDASPEERRRWITGRQQQMQLASEIRRSESNAGGRKFVPPPGARWQLALPAWLPTVVFLIPSAVWLLARLWRRHRRRKGLCPNCGYDLRASKDRCPECGEPIATTAATEPSSDNTLVPTGALLNTEQTHLKGQA